VGCGLHKEVFEMATHIVVRAKVLKNLPAALKWAVEIVEYIRDTHKFDIRPMARSGGPWEITWTSEHADVGEAAETVAKVGADPGYWEKLRAVEEQGIFDGFEFSYWNDIS
jgi:hypothetical protein